MQAKMVDYNFVIFFLKSSEDTDSWVRERVDYCSQLTNNITYQNIIFFWGGKPGQTGQYSETYPDKNPRRNEVSKATGGAHFLQSAVEINRVSKLNSAEMEIGFLNES
jgi:hypothetical protein